MRTGRHRNNGQTALKADDVFSFDATEWTDDDSRAVGDNADVDDDDDNDG